MKVNGFRTVKRHLSPQGNGTIATEVDFDLRDGETSLRVAATEESGVSSLDSRGNLSGVV